MKRLWLLLALWAALAPLWAQAPWEQQMSDYERENLRLNRQWIATRGRTRPKAEWRVGVVAGAGVWHQGARALVTALERKPLGCDLLDPSRLEDLSQYRAILLPGGYAGYQYYALGPEGCRRLTDYVEGGGRLLGICAGAYLISKTVRYDGLEYPYPLGLFDGVAEGPVAGLPTYPNYGPCRLKVTPAGQALGLGPIARRTLEYGGGPRLLGGTSTTVLLEYEDGTPAAISRSYGKGRVVALGAHLEVELPSGTVPAGSEELLLRLLQIAPP